MREILFRGKRKDNGEWIKGDFCSPCNIVFLENRYDAVLGKDDCPMCNDFEVIPETVGQYTGLTDKNGKKIFEGDIIKIYLYEPKGLANYEVGCIKYDNTKARFVFCTKEGNYSIDNSNAFEVIGNTHDNPELLKGGAE